ncbi:Ig-like domain-containing protein [Oerskovia sp. NPDC057915]|uniref:Ig-like domain-containing protein n=1 Tax=Oerskovia sp. NPDC057915 TaxID=3346280 RepID=UPI0036DAB245
MRTTRVVTSTVVSAALVLGGGATAFAADDTAPDTSASEQTAPTPAPADEAPAADAPEAPASAPAAAAGPAATAPAGPSTGSTASAATGAPAAVEPAPPPDQARTLAAGPAISLGTLTLTNPARAASWDADVQGWVRSQGYPTATITSTSFAWGYDGGSFIAVSNLGPTLRFSPYFPDTYVGYKYMTVVATASTGQTYRFQIDMITSMHDTTSVQAIGYADQPMTWKLSDHYPVPQRQDGSSTPSSSYVTTYAKPRIGTATVGADGDTWTYDSAGVGGVESFVLQSAIDGSSFTVPVYLSRLGRPAFGDDAASTVSSTSVEIPYAANDTSGKENWNTSFTFTTPGHGSVTVGYVGGRSVFTYVPEDGFAGVDTFTYTGVDRLGTSTTATVSVTVGAAVDDHATTQASTPVTVDVLANDSYAPVDGTITTTVPGHGTATVVDGKVVYTPADGFVGTDTFTYTMTGTDGLSTTAVVVVDVTAAPAVDPRTGDDPVDPVTPVDPSTPVLPSAPGFPAGPTSALPTAPAATGGPAGAFPVSHVVRRASSAGRLARTGVDAGALVALAGLLTAAGAAAVALRRRFATDDE